jgi:hypothetical protein
MARKCIGWVLVRTLTAKIKTVLIFHGSSLFRRDIFLFLHGVGGTSDKSVNGTNKIFKKKGKKLSSTGDEF